MLFLILRFYANNKKGLWHAFNVNYEIWYVFCYLHPKLYKSNPDRCKIQNCLSTTSEAKSYILVIYVYYPKNILGGHSHIMTSLLFCSWIRLSDQVELSQSIKIIYVKILLQFQKKNNQAELFSVNFLGH